MKFNYFISYSNIILLEMDHSFEYPEQLVYLYKKRVHVYDIEYKKVLTSVRYHLYNKQMYGDFLDRDLTAVACKNTDLLLIVGTEKGYGEAEYTVVVLDRKLDIIKEYYTYRSVPKSLTANILLGEIGSLNFNAESVEDKYGEKTSLPHDAIIHKTGADTFLVDSERGNHNHYQNICYDKYTDTVLMLISIQRGESFDSGEYFIEEWKKSDTNWILLGTSPILQMDIIPRKSSEVYHFECGRKYISLGVKYGKEISRRGMICLYDKNSFKSVNSFPGYHPTFWDDYDRWFGKSLQTLKNTEILNKINEDLLKLILFYIS